MPKTRRNTKKRGGGFAVGTPLSSTAYYVAENKSYDDCYAQARPGEIQSNPNPELAQIRMAGGSRYGKVGGACPCKLGGSRKRRGLRKGSLKRRSTMKGRRGGSLWEYFKTGGSLKGGRYMIDPGSSIGGDGPIVAPVWSTTPCEGHRPMPINPTTASMLGSSDNPSVEVGGLRPAFIQSAGGNFNYKRPTINNAQGSQSNINMNRLRPSLIQQGGLGFSPLTYSNQADNNSLAYTAPRAGFTFMPNIAQQQVLQPGQIPYQEVVPQHDNCSNSSCGLAIANINKA